MELLYQLALTLVPNIGDVHARVLIDHLGDAASVFKERTEVLEKIEGIGRVRAVSIKSFTDFSRAEAEIRFIDQYRIKTYFITEKDYPQRLLQCQDAPVLLFYKGSADLNAAKMVSVVGTRSHTEHGRQATEMLITALANENITIVSGLAYGVDALAHKAAMKYNLPTVGIIGHGLDSMYPYDHIKLAQGMIRQGGGVLTEFLSGTQPDRHNFPLRNRIVAGISDATIVIETHVKGGSMITAKLADAYNRDVLAFPGRFNDRASSGCNQLIKYNKAILLTGADQLLDVMGWKEKDVTRNAQRQMFIEMTEEEQKLTQILVGKETLHISELNALAGLSASEVARALLNLELKNIINSLPGQRYSLI